MTRVRRWSRIDPKYLNPNSRFGRGFYAAEQPETALAELAHHAAEASPGIRFSVEQSALRILDLTDPAIAKAWGYVGGPTSRATQAIGAEARNASFNAIRSNSLRGPGTKLAIIDVFKDVLIPQMVSPAK